jgi:serine/threonine-protein kinase
VAACTACRQSIPEHARFCPSCGAPVAFTEQPTTFEDAATVLGDASPARLDRPASGRPRAHSNPSSSGWLSSSGAHGRFEPGTILGDRYRIVARLGQGGMGEVYRADDLKLGQPVALKFLPPTLERDTVRLAQFHNEVRLARQVAHKNVCRMYDVGDADGLPFLTMEYVDGEDLATLIRRIGRLPEDKALDLARQLCAGLAAAHERGVLHRDLKPANVMIDGQGQVRITDFGLAAIAGEVDQVRVGTPAYMAPEQLAGKGVSVQSDLYALGLVLYELFTGRRAYTAQNVAELVRQHEEPQITPPTALVRDMDPAIERAILRCIDPNPASRPRSALAVAAALPGGDPLAAALAAGETPSPEMVAAAGERQAASGTAAVLGAAGVIGLFAIGIVVAARFEIVNRTPFDKPPAVLVDRAQQLLATAGDAEVPTASHWGYNADGDYLRYVREHPEYSRAANPYADRPAGLTFYYRTSPRRLVPFNAVGPILQSDPPLIISGMTAVTLDPQGRVEMFHAIPPQVDSSTTPGSPIDWAPMFRHAGLDITAFTPADPEWLPRGQSDERKAWKGVFPERPDTPMRVEAAAWRGRVIYFQVVGPWTRPVRMQEAPVTTSARVMSVVNVLFFFALLAAALVVSRMNLRAGRGDQRGAARLVVVALVGQMITWVFNDPHGMEPQVELNRFFLSVGEALFAGALLCVMYLALEPLVRRYWPDSLLGWTRLLHGEILDARVGRDVLVGLAGGAALFLLLTLQWPLQYLAGHEGDAVHVGNLRVFEGPSYQIGLFSSLLAYQSAFNAMWCIFTLVGLKRLLKRMWLVAIIASLFFTFVAASSIYTDQAGFFWLHFVLALSVVSVLMLVAIRFGLLSTAAAFIVTNWATGVPWTLDTDRWDFHLSVLAFALIAALAVFGAWAARTPQSPGAVGRAR